MPAAGGACATSDRARNAVTVAQRQAALVLLRSVMRRPASLVGGQQLGAGRNDGHFGTMRQGVLAWAWASASKTFSRDAN